MLDVDGIENYIWLAECSSPLMEEVHDCSDSRDSVSRESQHFLERGDEAIRREALCERG